MNFNLEDQITDKSNKTIFQEINKLLIFSMTQSYSNFEIVIIRIDVKVCTNFSQICQENNIQGLTR